MRLQLHVCKYIKYIIANTVAEKRGIPNLKAGNKYTIKEYAYYNTVDRFYFTLEDCKNNFEYPVYFFTIIYDKKLVMSETDY